MGRDDRRVKTGVGRTRKDETQCVWYTKDSVTVMGGRRKGVEDKAVEIGNGRGH